MEKKLEHLFKAVELIDVDVMGWFIPDAFVVNKTGKDMLLKKVGDISQIFKQYQNTKLNIRVSRLFEDKKQLAIVVWGNISKHFVSFILEKESDLVMSSSTCMVHEFFDYLNLDEAYRIDVNYFKDEMIDFVPNMKYFKENDLYQELINELEVASEDYLDIDNIECWLDCAAEAYDKLTPYRLQFRNCFIFYKNYNTLLDILALIELDATVVESIDNLQEIKQSPNSNIFLNTWVEDYQWLYEELLGYKRYSYLLVADSSQLKISGLFNISVGNMELINAMNFLETYDAHVIALGATPTY